MHPGLRTVTAAVAISIAGCVPNRPAPQIASLEVGVDQPVATDAVYAAGGSCLDQLRARGAIFEQSEAFHTGRGCGIGDPVVLRTGIAEIGPNPQIECEMALAWLDFEQRVVQPLAQEILNQPVAYIHQVSDYTCRVSTGNRRKLSQHAHGLALDVAAFELPDGQIASVEAHYYADSKEGEFIRAVAEKACAFFSVVLTPNSDRYHSNHFHLDIGDSGICSL
jgi:hypothetical protein